MTFIKTKAVKKSASFTTVQNVVSVRCVGPVNNFTSVQMEMTYSLRDEVVY